MLFNDKKKRQTTTEETLKVTQKIATGIEKLQSSMENLATSIDTQTNKVEVSTFGKIVLRNLWKNAEFF